MPIVRITWFAGRDQAARERVARGVADLMRAEGAPAGSTTVLFEDVPRDHWSVDGKIEVDVKPQET